MSVLIKNAIIIAPGNKLHNSKRDILIKGGKIEKIASKIAVTASQVISSSQLHVSAGWIDIGATCSEPGYEHRESLETLSQTAAAGGYTALAILPNTQPCIDNKSALQFVKNHNSITDIYPIGAISKQCKGEEIAEMIDMKHNGAVAFSDGHHCIQSSGLMMRALDYAKATDSIIIQHPVDNVLANGNHVHEGEVSTALGIKGNPSISETLMLRRDLELNKYTDSQLLIHNISSAESISHLNKNSKNTFASVCYLNLIMTDIALDQFDVYYKVNPPLRAESDRKALVKALKQKKISVITSNHTPLEEEAKKVEFTYAKNGAIGLQTMYSGLRSLNAECDVDDYITAISTNPRGILGLPEVKIGEGESANLTLFDPNEEWTYNEDTNLSKSKNSPFWNQNLKGKVIGIINGTQHFFNNY